MSTKGEVLYHPINGATEETWDGFSWPGFFFGAIWLAVKQLWVHFVVSFIIIVITGGFGAIPVWIFYGFAGNSIHKKSLLSKGYLTKEQHMQKNKQGQNFTTASNNSGIADELSKLAELHKSGVLTEEEFKDRKQRLLGA